MVLENPVLFRCLIKYINILRRLVLYYGNIFLSIREGLRDKIKLTCFYQMGFIS